jgi:hypothetical protein
MISTCYHNLQTVSSNVLKRLLNVTQNIENATMERSEIVTVCEIMLFP